MGHIISALALFATLQSVAVATSMAATLDLSEKIATTNVSRSLKPQVAVDEVSTLFTTTIDHLRFHLVPQGEQTLPENAVARWVNFPADLKAMNEPKNLEQLKAITAGIPPKGHLREKVALAEVLVDRFGVAPLATYVSKNLRYYRDELEYWQPFKHILEGLVEYLKGQELSSFEVAHLLSSKINLRDGQVSQLMQFPFRFFAEYEKDSVRFFAALFDLFGERSFEVKSVLSMDKTLNNVLNLKYSRIMKKLDSKLLDLKEPQLHALLIIGGLKLKTDEEQKAVMKSLGHIYSNDALFKQANRVWHNLDKRIMNDRITIFSKR